MTTTPEMTIPKSLKEVIFQIVIISIIVLFAILAVIDISNHVAMIPSGIWLTLVTLIIVTESRRARGLGTFLINVTGAIIGRQFVEIASPDAQSKEVHFGYQLFGQRHILQRVTLDKIETVEWNAGQATAMAGRDMNDWHVCLWFHHGDPAESLRKQGWKKPDQNIYIVGPSRRKQATVAFGRLFVAFLRTAGAQLVQAENENCYVRSSPGTTKVHPT